MAKPQRKKKIMSQFGFNLSDYDNVDTGASADFSPIPPGQYQLLIDAGEIKQTKAGDDMLVLTYVVENGEFAGRKIWDNLVYGHSSEKVQNIARSKMAALQRALGKECPGPDDFVGGTFIGKVGVSPAKDNYAASNRLDRVVENGAAPAAQPAAQAAPQQNTNAKPW